jgi:hypothetical protein
MHKVPLGRYQALKAPFLEIIIIIPALNDRNPFSPLAPFTFGGKCFLSIEH